jgi:hypothetical protein
MLATLDPLGVPLTCQMVAGQRADEGLYIPAYDAAVMALGTSQLLVVGDSKMGGLATRGHIVAGQSRYLCAYRPPAATTELATWIATALARPDQWQVLETVDPTTGAITTVAEIDEWQRPQTWCNPVTGTCHTWTERVLVERSAAYQAGLRQRRERALAQLTEDLTSLWQPPARGRKRYRRQEDLARLVAERIARAGLTGIVQARVAEERLPDGTTRWVVAALWVDWAAWQAMIERLGWQVYVTNTTPMEYTTAALVAAYQQQAIHERGFSRLKTRHLQIRPVYVRDEQRIAGLLWLLCLALRVLTLTEYRVRSALAERDEALAGLNPASRTQTTQRPTTERVIAAFTNITCTTMTAEGVSLRHVSPLNATQRYILVLLRLPAELYEGLERPSGNLIYHLRE